MQARFYRVRPECKERYKPYNGGLYRELSPPSPQGYACVLLGPRVQAVDVRDFELILIDEADPSVQLVYRVRPEYLHARPPYDGRCYLELRAPNHTGFACVLVDDFVRWIYADQFDRIWGADLAQAPDPVAVLPDLPG